MRLVVPAIAIYLDLHQKMYLQYHLIFHTEDEHHE